MDPPQQQHQQQQHPEIHDDKPQQKLIPMKSEDVQLAEITHQEDISGDDNAKPQPGPTFTLEEENAVYRKLDWNLLPLIFVLYSLSVLDRGNLGNARIAGMEDEIDLKGRRYAWLATIFYIACKISLTNISLIHSFELQWRR